MFGSVDEKSGGLCSEKDYPYKAKQGKVCMTNCTDVEGSIVKTFIDVPVPPTSNNPLCISAVLAIKLLPPETETTAFPECRSGRQWRR